MTHQGRMHLWAATAHWQTWCRYCGRLMLNLLCKKVKQKPTELKEKTSISTLKIYIYINIFHSRMIASFYESQIQCNEQPLALQYILPFICVWSFNNTENTNNIEMFVATTKKDHFKRRCIYIFFCTQSIWIMIESKCFATSCNG